MTTNSPIMDILKAPAPTLWFEYLLEPDKLRQHLESNSCDPSPTELINLFLRNITSDEAIDNEETSKKPFPNSKQTGNIPDFSDSLPILNDPRAVNNIPPGSYEAEYHMKKCYGLQILAIKVASYLKWDLDIICNNLNMPVQLILMHSLQKTCNSSEDTPSEVKIFLGIIYSHWLLRSAINLQLTSLHQPQSHNTTIIYLSQYQQQQQNADNNVMNFIREFLGPQSKELDKWASYLHSYLLDLSQNREVTPKRLKTTVHPFRRAKLLRPKLDCFVASHDGASHNWEECEPVDCKEFLEAACYDLGKYYFFRESYQLAKTSFELIREPSDKFPHLTQYIESATKFLSSEKEVDRLDNRTLGHNAKVDIGTLQSEVKKNIEETRLRTEKYIFDCMTQFSKTEAKKSKKGQVENNDASEYYEIEKFNMDSDLRLNVPSSYQHPSQNSLLPNKSCHWYQVPTSHVVQAPYFTEANRGDLFMVEGNFKEAMACFTGALLLITDYFTKFSKNYQDEEPYISRMIQCSISLSCFTQAVALCQMSKNLNYTIAFKQLNERVCNDCCDDIYECIWNVTLLEYIINLHSRRGEIERRAKVIQLIGQLELNENNQEEILREAEHVRRGKFFRILSNKYL